MKQQMKKQSLLMSIKIKQLVLMLVLTMTTVQAAKAQEQPLELTLQESVVLALKNNPQITIAALEVDRSQLEKKITISQLLPTISANGQYLRNIKRPVIFLPDGSPFGDVLEMGSDNSYTFQGQANMPIFSLPLYKGIELQKTAVLVAEESQREAIINLATEVKKAYFNVLLSQESKEVLRQSQVNAEQNLENIRNLFSQGVVAEYDVIRAEVQVQNLQPDIVQAENNLQLARNTLKLQLGLEAETDITIIESLDDFEEEIDEVPTLDEATRKILVENSTLNQLRLQTEMAQEQISLQRSQWYPTLNATGNYSLQSQANNFEFSTYDWVPSATAGLQLSIPIFSGFSKRYQLQQAQIGLEQAQLQTEHMAQSLELQAQEAIYRMTQAMNQIENQEATIRQAEKGYEIALTSYRAGAATLLEVNDAELALTQARLNLLQSVYNYMTAKADYQQLIANVYPDAAE